MFIHDTRGLTREQTNTKVVKSFSVISNFNSRFVTLHRITNRSRSRSPCPTDDSDFIRDRVLFGQSHWSVTDRPSRDHNLSVLHRGHSLARRSAGRRADEPRQTLSTFCPQSLMRRHKIRRVSRPSVCWTSPSYLCAL